MAGTRPSGSSGDRGSQRALRLRRIFDETHDLTWRVLRRFGVPTPLLEDGFQQVYLITAERLDDIDPNRERAFVYGVTLRVSRSIYRQVSREVLGDEPDLHVGTHHCVDALLDQKRLAEACDEILGRMPQKLRSTFLLHDIEALSTAETAGVLGVPHGTVSSRLRRARELFRAEVEALSMMPHLTEALSG
jgi:RNA polymerase sigma-70 factor (ECF subfamily)